MEVKLLEICVFDCGCGNGVSVWLGMDLLSFRVIFWFCFALVLV